MKAWVIKLNSKYWDDLGLSWSRLSRATLYGKNEAKETIANIKTKLKKQLKIVPVDIKEIK